MLRALDRLRCPICLASWWLDHGGEAQCSHCRLIVRNAAVLPTVVAELRRRLASGIATFDPATADWWTDDAGARNLAWRVGYTARRPDGSRIRPDDRLAAVITAPARPIEHRVTLAVMARADDPRADDLIERLSAAFPNRIVLLDTDSAVPHAHRFPGTTVAAHPLGGDYAGQRNRLQDMAGSGWVLQVDSDECPDPALIAALGWLTGEADRDGLRSLGLARRNIVDGHVSALYPDIQYRLNRADVRFGNRVHERPIVPFEETSLALVGTLDHRLTGDRVRARTRIYEGLSAGAGRPEDEARLLERFDPIALR